MQALERKPENLCNFKKNFTISFEIDYLYRIYCIILEIVISPEQKTRNKNER